MRISFSTEGNRSFPKMFPHIAPTAISFTTQTNNMTVRFIEHYAIDRIVGYCYVTKLSLWSLFNATFYLVDSYPSTAHPMVGKMRCGSLSTFTVPHN